MTNAEHVRVVKKGATGRMAVRDRFADIRTLIDTPSPFIVDGGAYIGATVDIFLRDFAAPTIMAFEPQPNMAKILQRKYGDRSNVTIHAQALGASATTVRFRVLNHDVSSSILAPTDRYKGYHGRKMDTARDIEVPLVRLDDAVTADAIDILKLDLQGYELQALRGAERILPNTRLVTTEIAFIPLYEGQALFADIDLYLRSFGFELFNLYDLFTQDDGQLTAGDAIYLNSRFY